MSHNDITGDKIVTKPASQAFRDNFDAIFKKKPAGPALCRKCPADPNKVCGYCGLRQADGSRDPRVIFPPRILPGGGTAGDCA